MEGYALPDFVNYPPYYTLQPVEETRNRQLELWRELILGYCTKQKTYKVEVRSGGGFPLFKNDQINRSLNEEAQRAVLDSMADRGQAHWTDSNSKAACLILWRSEAEWGELLRETVHNLGLAGSLVTVPELRGEEVAGTELAGIPEELLMLAVRNLESRGIAKYLKGEDGLDASVKFLS